MDNQELEKAISDRPFPKVTKESIEARIARVDYYPLPDNKTLICNITLVNGFTVRGESACVDPRNFSMEIGKKISYDNAFDKLWELEGYLLAEKLWSSPHD